VSKIIKTRAIVLKKIKYGDSSKILTLLSRDFGKISGIIKGARSSRSRIGAAADLFNHIEIVFYNKQGRDLQIITQVDLINGYPNIKDDLEKIKYASAISELTNRLTLENEEHQKIYNGILKLFQRLNDESENEQLLFAKFFLFFINELGYGLNMSGCFNCGEDLLKQGKVYLDYERGFICDNCLDNQFSCIELSQELFDLFNCLSRRQNDIKTNRKNLDKVVLLLEKYLKYHLSEFDEIKSLRMF